MDNQNEKISELTKKQMETVSGGEDFFNPCPDVLTRGHGTDCFVCHGRLNDGTSCGKPLQHVSGKLYRFKNPLCSLFASDQYPTV